MNASADGEALRAPCARVTGNSPCLSEGLPADAASAAAGGWLTVTDAARKTGTSRRAWQLRARRLAPDGLAVRLRTRGQFVWWLSPRAAITISRKSSGQLVNLHDVPAAGRERAYRRLRWLREYWNLCAANPQSPRQEAAAKVAAFARAEGIRCSVRSLQGWERAYHAPAPDGGILGVAGLLDRYGYATSKEVGSDQATPTRSPEAVAFFHSLYRTEQKLPAQRCHQLTVIEARQRGWHWPASYSATTTWLRRYDNRALTYLIRYGFTAYMHRYGAYVQQDHSAVNPGEVFVADSHLLKAVCLFHGRLVRPWLIVNLDVATRCVVGWTLSPYANQDAILDGLRSSYVRWAIPKCQKIDNGRDYGARLFHGSTKKERKHAVHEAQKAHCDRPEWRGILPELGIDVQFALPFNPQSKLVERWFRTLTDQAVRMLVSFVDTDPVRRPEAHRLVTAADKEISCKRAVVPTIEEVRDVIRGYITEYHRTPHRGDGMNKATPLAAWEARARCLRKASPDALRLLMQIRGPSKVGANGVRLAIAGTTFWYGRDDETLRRWKGREVLIAVDHEDVSQAVVFTPDRQLLTVVPMNDRIASFGADAQQLRDAIRKVRRARGDRKKALNSAAVRMQTPQDILREHQARMLREADGSPPSPNARLKLVSTGFETAYEAVKTHRENLHTEPVIRRTLADVPAAEGVNEATAARRLTDLAEEDRDPVEPVPFLERLEEADGDA